MIRPDPEKLRRFLYRVFAALFPVMKRKVLFLSDIRANIGGNYGPLLPELEKRGFRVICDFKPSKKYNEGRKRKYMRSWHLATAGYIVLEDFHADTAWINVRKGQELIQLWHAAGAFKRFAWSRNVGGEKIAISPGYSKTTAAIVSAEAIRHNYAEAYDIDISKVHATGIPRTDIFFDREYTAGVRSRYDEKYPGLKGKNILLVAPTYRGKYVTQATYDFDRLDPGRMLETLGDEWVIVMKWHPATQTTLRKKKQEAYDYSLYGGRVMDLSDERDVNDLLIIADAMITDYSSVIFEYEIMNRPVIYYWYDIEDYEGGRGMYYDLDEYVYGSVAHDFDQLLEALAKMDLCEDRRAAFRAKFMAACDGHSTERVADMLFARKDG